MIDIRNFMAVMGAILLLTATAGLITACGAEYREIEARQEHNTKTTKQSPATDKYYALNYRLACISGNEYIVDAHRFNLSPHLDDDGVTAIKCTVEKDVYQ